MTATFYTGQVVDLPTPTWYVDKDELVRYSFPWGSERYFFTSGNGWLGPGYKLTITYNHGFDSTISPAPYQLQLAKAIVVEMCARVWVNPEAAAQSMVGGVQAGYSAAGLMLTVEELADLHDTFRRRQGSITLG